MIWEKELSTARTPVTRRCRAIKKTVDAQAAGRALSKRLRIPACYR